MTKKGSFLRTGLLAGLLIDAALVGYGKLVAPAISPISLAAPLVILLVYALLAVLVLPRLDRMHPRILKLALLFGLIAGAIFAGEIVLEYILLPADNTPYGLVEFGSVFTLYFLSGLAAAYLGKSMRQAVLTALAAAVIASLIWDVSVLAVFHAMRGSAQQVQVLRAEGDYLDFARSGIKDFSTFVVEDMMGATFYHLLLGPVAAAVLGAAGGLLGKLLARSRKIG
jgi:hypothetical protein